MTSNVQERHPTTISTPSDTEIRIEREFDAPRELVWEAYTDPEMVAEWLGPRDSSRPEITMDLRTGGSYRWDFGEYKFFGDFREVVPQERIVTTFDWETSERQPSVDHAEFEDLGDGRTRIVIMSTFASKEDRDAMIADGMERGVRDGYSKMDELLERLKTERAGS
jgi:uncharacterized protein YndB with AHSA1/START domain